MMGNPLRCFACLAVLVAAATAQPTITGVSPATASPGDVIYITGSFPVGVTHIQFTATVGGFAGVNNQNIVPISVTPTLVVVAVPTMAGFAPPNASPPGDPMGSLRARDAGGLFSATQPFYFHQGSFANPNGTIPLLQTVGLGTTNSIGRRAATSFDINAGPPNLPSGNPSFTLTLENATPVSSVTLVLGQADATPTLMIGDGLVGIDLSGPYVFWPSPPAPMTTDLSGEATITFAIPPGPLGVSMAAGWGYIDGVTLRVSNTLSANL